MRSTPTTRGRGSSDRYVVAAVAEAIAGAARGLAEGARVEEVLWPVARDAGVRRREFDAAVDLLIAEHRYFRSYDRLHEEIVERAASHRDQPIERGV